VGFFLPVSVFPSALVSGAGPTGCVAALALAASGWRVLLHDPSPPEALRQRARAYAITHSTRRLLRSLGLWEGLLPHLQPFHRLLLSDRASGAPEVVFADADDAVGWVLDHRPLMDLLLLRCFSAAGLQLHLGEPERPPLSADLLVHCEGAGSQARGALGIGFAGWDYHQGCLTCQVQLEGAAPATAWEVFRPEGPLAVLPLGGGRAQVVWSGPLEACRHRQSLGEAGFLQALGAVLPPGLQACELLEPPASFPVACRLASRLARGRALLCGESGHRCHPVGGQGLNLCWRDVAVLWQEAAAVASGERDIEALPRRYARRRWADAVITLAATDLLIRLFSNRWLPLLALRRLGLWALGHSGPLRSLALAAASQGVLPSGSLPGGIDRGRPRGEQSPLFRRA
jgi:2-octaprenyl-6-methoxyphenol hydroxylase